MKKPIVALLAAWFLAAPATAQVIVTVPYRPPETVQRVVIPVNPAVSGDRHFDAAGARRGDDYPTK